MSYINRIKLKGITLIEMLLSIALISLIILAATTILITSKRLHDKTYNMEKTGIELDYALDYIIKEIDSSDYITGIERENELRNWLGFVFISENNKSIKEKYSYTTYYLEDNCIYRLNFKFHRIKESIYINNFQGKNNLIGGISEFTSTIDNDLLSLKITTNDGEKIEICHKLRGSKID